MAGNEIFKTVMKGYKKEEVTSYIADLSEQMQLLKNDLDRKDVEIDRLHKDLADAMENNVELGEEQMQALRAEIRQQVEEELRAENEAKMAEIAADAPMEKSDDLSEVERKAKEYDECKDALADLMIQARRNADDIMEKAEAKAQMLRAKSEAQYAQLSTQFALLQNNVSNIRSALQINLDQIVDQLDQFEEQLGQLQTEVDRTVSSTNSEE